MNNSIKYIVLDIIGVIIGGMVAYFFFDVKLFIVILITTSLSSGICFGYKRGICFGYKRGIEFINTKNKSMNGDIVNMKLNKKELLKAIENLSDDAVIKLWYNR